MVCILFSFCLTCITSLNGVLAFGGVRYNSPDCLSIESFSNSLIIFVFTRIPTCYCYAGSTSSHISNRVVTVDSF